MPGWTCTGLDCKRTDDLQWREAKICLGLPVKLRYELEIENVIGNMVEKYLDKKQWHRYI